MGGAGRPVAREALSGTGTRKERLRLFSEIPSDEKRLIFTVLLIACATFGAFGAFALTRHDDAQASEPLLLRTQNGSVQTGEVATVTEDGKVRRVIRWRTKEGKVITDTVTGPTSYRTAAGERVFVAGPTSTVNQTRTVTTPGPTVTETVAVHDTVTEVQTVTEIQTVTETVRRRNRGSLDRRGRL